MQNNNIFEFLDWILKKKKEEPIYENNITPYLLNRWISMVDSDCVKILNITQNRWNIEKIDVDDDFNKLVKFYRILLPKINKKIEYIKKTKNLTNEKDENLDSIAKNFEISKREVLKMEQLKKELNIEN
jgi:hypothetical protein